MTSFPQSRSIITGLACKDLGGGVSSSVIWSLIKINLVNRLRVATPAVSGEGGSDDKFTFDPCACHFCDYKKKDWSVTQAVLEKRESLVVENGVRFAVAEEPEVGLVQLVEFFSRLDRHCAEPVGFPAAGCEVPAGGGELHHIIHAEEAQQVLRILLRRLQMAHKVVLDLARVAEPVNLPPVLVKRHLLLRIWVQEVLDEVREGGVDARLECLVYGGGRRWLVGVATQHGLCKMPVEFAIWQLEFVPVGGDEAHERVPHENKFGVFLQFYLQKTKSALAHTTAVTPRWPV